MKSVACLCLLALVVALSARSADALPMCAENFCASVRCAAVDPTTCDGVVRQNASICGCCDACVRVLQAGEACLDLHRRALPSFWECVEGTTCVKHVCTAVEDVSGQ